ncbi:MAG: GerMN domain-containing protein, partial [Firmicutes bacterium]|nr:GerMN domain-containing protein [Bacillota bacterium]
KGEVNISIFVLLPDGSFAPLPRVVSMDSYVGLSDAVAKAVANEMVSGDPEPCFPRLFPEDAQLASVTLTNGICTVDFPSSFPNHFDPPAELNQALAGLRYALLNVSGVESVRFTVGGEVYG